MATFENLEIDKFYLIRVKDEDAITMVQVGMFTDRCVLVYIFNDDFETTYWKKKDDYIAEIIECLSEEYVDAYESLLENDMNDHLDDDFIAESFNGKDHNDDFAFIEEEHDHDHDKKKKKKKKK